MIFYVHEITAPKRNLACYADDIRYQSLYGHLIRIFECKYNTHLRLPNRVLQASTILDGKVSVAATEDFVSEMVIWIK